ncbi:MAG TPA: peptide deformylase [Burkholderiales bacterium]|nr:peptide deformylase [Burkholderiales bacterium]
MALLPILHYPDERLHRTAAPVESINDNIRRLVRDMADTMYAAPGIGLAAPQVDVLSQVVVIDLSEAHDDLRVFINPEIVELRGQTEYEEGCLSVPGIYERVKRAEWVKVRALNEKGDLFDLETDGLLAVCIQHEIDHLKGKVFVDYLSRLKQSRIATKLKKQQRRAM